MLICRFEDEISGTQDVPGDSDDSSSRRIIGSSTYSQVNVQSKTLKV